MTRKVYRAMTIASLALLAINITQKDWLGEFFGSPISFIPLGKDAYMTLQWNFGNTLLILLCVGFSYLWLSSKNSP